MKAGFIRFAFAAVPLAFLTACGGGGSEPAMDVVTKAVSFDPDVGTGFVGKGDVQLALGLNNQQLQAQAASLAFTYESISATETTWTCDRDAGPQTQERSRTTTTTTQGVVSAVARERNQITGFNLTGFSGTPTTDSETEGPAAGSCATGWTAIGLVVGQPTVLASGLYVNGVLSKLTTLREQSCCRCCHCCAYAAHLFAQRQAHGNR